METAHSANGPTSSSPNFNFRGCGAVNPTGPPLLTKPVNICVSGRRLKEGQLRQYRIPSAAELSFRDCFSQATPGPRQPGGPAAVLRARALAARRPPGKPRLGRQRHLAPPPPFLLSVSFPAPARLQLFWLSGGAKEKGAVSQMKAGCSRGHPGARRAAAGAGQGGRP